MSPDPVPPIQPHRSERPQTTAVTAGRPERAPDAPLNQPPVLASTYVGGGDTGYGRYGNPSWTALESTVGALEGGRAISFASGMAAVHAILELVPPGGTVVLPRHCYLGVAALAGQLQDRGALTVRVVDLTSPAAVLEAGAGADMVWLESPTNPMMEIADLATIGAGLRGTGCTFVVDNTFATPLLQRPFGFGADVVLHSATKFLSGHSDALLGVAVVHDTDTDRLSRLDTTRRLHGATPGALESYLVLRGIRTLHVRLQQAQATASELAHRLQRHPSVVAVHYPGLDTDPGHQVAAAQMTGFGSLLSIDLGSADAADAFVAAARLWVHATSLGGVESTFERRRRWPSELVTVPPGLVRMSVGIEHLEDLWQDLEQALTASRTPAA
ncbi:aminotransferase class I/II-fold pyridoxal phosphate-dependent enzyme [Microlunatus panaciterrae]|uniref:Cystathionine gamma-synthase n=1 Tax=Microlunatus panaciterrae TaxID=400768 RepID=A0ABS2RQX8_9ACTN|nr:PLP-dependent aspartate aminotransferase family protein [Microlunatus panaciterrae]MBM7800566.1 cystathionine gamma-synthase [Microlunatus panaciterrae]